MNINEFIFSRTQPLKKIETVKAMTTDELFSVSETTVKRIIKETGRKIPKTRDKELYIASDRRRGNNWNSLIEGGYLIKGHLYLNLYIQYENTDTNTTEDYDEFFRRWSEYRGEIRRLDRYGNPRTYYFCYGESDKAEVLRSILLEFIYRKYNQKLQGQ